MEKTGQIIRENSPSVEAEEES